MTHPDDLLTALDEGLREARETAAAAVDRADAFRELRDLARQAAHRLRRPIHGPRDLHAADDEDARARVAALTARISP